MYLGKKGKFEMKKYFLILLAVLLLTAPALAEDEIEAIGHFSGWRVYKGTQSGKKTCFMSAIPLHTSKKRDDVYLMVARHPDDKRYNEIVVMLGAPYHQTSKPTIGVDNQKVISMYAVDGNSWIENDATEKELIQKMIEGNVVRTVGKSARGTILKDTFSLKGFTKALEAITKECPEQ